MLICGTNLFHRKTKGKGYAINYVKQLIIVNICILGIGMCGEDEMSWVERWLSTLV